MDISVIVQKGRLFLRDKGPDIAIVSGVVELIGAGVLACRATRKIDEILDGYHHYMAEIDRKFAKVPDDPKEAAAQAKNEKKERRQVYREAAWRIAKLYGLSIGLGAAGTISILSGAGILRKRNAALAAAYATLDSSYREYQRRVKEKYGEEAEKEIRYGYTDETIELKDTDENGEEVSVEKTVRSVKPVGYQRIFAYGESTAAEPNSDYNEMFLIGQQEAANRLLRAKGFLFWNELLEMLGYPLTVEGQEVGWVYDPVNPEGDNHIDLRITKVRRQKSDMINDYETAYMIDPNVDGPITAHLFKLGKIEKG